MFALQLILIIGIVAGIVAYLGNFVGRYFGRRKLSIFNLRPRYTATMFTVLTGIMIALVTFMILISISEDVRIALFGLEQLKSEVLNKSRELRSAKEEYEKGIKRFTEDLKKKEKESKKIEKEIKDDIADMQHEKSRLNNDIARLRGAVVALERGIIQSKKGKLIYRLNDPIFTTVMEGGGSKDAVTQKIKVYLSTTDTIIRRAALITSKKRIVYFGEAEFNETVAYIQKHSDKSIVLRVLAAQNIVAGEIAPVHFELFINSLVFDKDEEIASGMIDGSLSLPEIEGKIKALLTHVNQTAKNRGIIPNPQGYVGDVSYSQIADISKDIKTLGTTASIKVIAADDIYTIGPLRIDFKISSNGI
ncbi:MAG: DUF3084 domain-containing protein [bacterium]